MWTIPIASAAPHIPMLLQHLHGTKIFACWDFGKGYWQCGGVPGTDCGEFGLKFAPHQFSNLGPSTYVGATSRTRGLVVPSALATSSGTHVKLDDDDDGEVAAFPPTGTHIPRSDQRGFHHGQGDRVSRQEGDHPRTAQRARLLEGPRGHPLEASAADLRVPVRRTSSTTMTAPHNFRHLRTQATVPWSAHCWSCTARSPSGTSRT